MNCSIVFKVMRGQVLFREDFLQFVDNDGDQWHRGLRYVYCLCTQTELILISKIIIDGFGLRSGQAGGIQF